MCSQAALDLLFLCTFIAGVVRIECALTPIHRIIRRYNNWWFRSRLFEWITSTQLWLRMNRDALLATNLMNLGLLGALLSWMCYFQNRTFSFFLSGLHNNSIDLPLIRWPPFLISIKMKCSYLLRVCVHVCWDRRDDLFSFDRPQTKELVRFFSVCCLFVSVLKWSNFDCE